MEKCNMCPRKCNVDRTTQLGFCKAKEKIEISKVMLHHWEEPLISGEEKDKGSGAIFFSHCNLQCVFCQNYEISHLENGDIYEINDLVNLFKNLEEKGALNINLVSPSHYAENILKALKIYKPKIPVVWNSGGYDDPETIKKLQGYVDIFLADFKYFSNKNAMKYSKCPNYFEFCSKSLLKMREICPKDEIQDGLMKKGIIVRHLILPNQIQDSKNILKWLKDNLGTETYLSLMSQYTPFGEAKKMEELKRKLKPLEYKIVKNFMLELGFNNGFVQELCSASENFIPDFKEKN